VTLTMEAATYSVRDARDVVILFAG